jgi:hypothetical protein
MLFANTVMGMDMSDRDSNGATLPTTQVDSVVEADEPVAPLKQWQMEAIRKQLLKPRLQWGVKGGVSFPSVKSLGDFQFMVSGEWRAQTRILGAGYQVGGFGRVNIDQFNIQAELLFWQYQYETDMLRQDDPDNRYSTGKVRDRSIVVPILFAWQYSIFRMYVGPQITLYRNVGYDYIPAITTNDGHQLVIQDIKTPQPYVRIIAGVGFEFWKMSLDIRYINNIRRTEQVIRVQDEDKPIGFDMMWQYFQLSAGFIF